MGKSATRHQKPSARSASPTVNATYQATGDDIVLISSDNVKFYVKRFYLLAFGCARIKRVPPARHLLSTVIRDMLEHPPPLQQPVSVSNTAADASITSEATPEIEIEVRAPIDELLLDMIHNRSIPNDIDWHRYEAVLQLCDKWGIESLVERIAWRLYKIVDKAPWGIFCIASKLDDLELAKAALAVMDHDQTVGACTITAIPYDSIANCALPYYVGLIRATAGALDQVNDPVYEHEDEFGEYTSRLRLNLKNRVDWAKAGGKFVPANRP